MSLLTEENEVFTDIISLSEKVILSKYSQLASVSKKGLTFHARKKFLPFPKRDIFKFLNTPVELFLSHYELPFFGVLKKISEIKEDLFEISIDFTEDTPLYYRECIEDLSKLKQPADKQICLKISLLKKQLSK